MLNHMNLWQHTNGTYYVRVERCKRYPHGKQTSLRTTDKTKAKRLLDVMQKKWFESRLADLDQGFRISIEDLKTEYTTCSDRSDLSKDTLRMDELALRNLGDVIGHTRAVRAITSEDLGLFKTACLGRGVKPVSIKTYFRHIRAALRYAVKNKYRESMPDIPKVKTPKRLPRILSKQEINKILSVAEKTDFEIWRYAKFALWTGCRLSECKGLQCQDIIDGQIRVIGKGDKQRSVPLADGAINAIGAIPNIGPVFKQWHVDTISHRFKKSCIAAGVNDAHFHNLRHSAASYMIENGIELTAVQEMLGHADIRTTQLYVNVRSSFLKKEIQKLNFNI